MTTIYSVPHLFAMAHGAACEGPHRCYYCGAPCGEQHPATAPGNSGHVKDSFTNRDTVRCPGSPWVCAGCGLCLREDCTVTLPDGGAKVGQMVRTYSWVVTADRAVAASKAHIDYLRRTCLDPPAPPFAISISPDGQKHYLYRGVVNRGGGVFTVTLAGEPVVLYPRALASLLDTAGRLAACVGKPGLAEPFSVNGTSAAFARYGEAAAEVLMKEWDHYRETGLGRLCNFLCPPKAECEREYPNIADDGNGPTAAAGPGHRGVPQGTGRAGRSSAGTGQGGGPGGAGDRQPTLFDPRPPVL